MEVLARGQPSTTCPRIGVFGAETQSLRAGFSADYSRGGFRTHRSGRHLLTGCLPSLQASRVVKREGLAPLKSFSGRRVGIPGVEVSSKRRVCCSVAPMSAFEIGMGGILSDGSASVLLQDLVIGAVTLVGALVWVRIFDEAAQRGIFEQKLSRKLVHISCGFLFMVFWPFFSSAPSGRVCAAVVPLVNTVRLVTIGTGLVKSESTVKAVSREGDPRELLRGPLYYVLVLGVVTLFYWRDSPVGVTALAMMCGGDGVADIIGRRFGKGQRLPWNTSKSWAGSLAMFVIGFLSASLIVSGFCWLGYYDCDLQETTAKIALLALAATVVESLPISSKLDDNFTVPMTVFVLGALLFPAAA